MIPTSFYMLGHKITVKHVGRDDPILTAAEAEATYCHCSKTIRIKTETNEQFSKSFVESVFYHELMHCLFEHAQRDDLSTDEKLVDLMGDLIYQFSKTSEY